MSSQGLHSLTTIIKRLEAATSRLEDLAASTSHIPTSDGSKAAPNTSSYVPSVSSPPPPPPPPPPAAAPAMQAVPKSVTAYDEVVIDGKLKPFLELTRSFAGPSVVEIVGLVEQQFKDLRDLLLTASACTKPDDKGLKEILAPIYGNIEAISRMKEGGRKDRDWFAHLMVIGEGAPSVGWVIQPKPGPYIGEIKDQVLYYGNRVIKDFKDKDPKHAEWVRSFTAVLDDLRKYVMEYHTTGLTWNTKGIPIAQHKSKPQGSPSAGGPPPPPPPPPPPVADASAPAASGGTAAVFAELNRGAEVTKNLRKVDKSEMTHKNPELRASSVVPSSVGSGAAAKKPLRPAKPQALMGKKPAKFALEGKAWNVEYHEDEKNLTVQDTQLNQVVNIFGCKNTVIQVKGKINAVTLVNCTKTSVLIESVVSSVSVTKSPSFQIQITGTCPMIQIDSTDSGQIYLSKSSLEAEITTAKCSSINVSLPVEDEEEGVYEEQPVPEMLKTVVKDGKLVTTVVEHVG
ncbi:suppressor of rasval19 [Marasmius crinis-equi]|uniref:Adenylyl cyclase-associated protein n=1 Tax=Marasmius crinis-equi TaxID=585013 RepID=A0ABR3FXH7_9AGAR